MGSSRRRNQRQDSPSRTLFVLGNVLLVLATLAVAGLVTYLVLYPPGALDPASQQAPVPTAPGAEAAPVAETAPAPVPPPPAPAPPEPMPGALSLGPACGAVSPLLTSADDIRNTAIEDSDALVTETISNLTRDLQALSDISPEELSTLIDPLIEVFVELNNAVLAGEENPDVDTEAATTSTDAIRTLCQG